MSEDIREVSLVGPAPVTILNRELNRDVKVDTLSDFLEYLPQQPFRRAEESTRGGTYVELRGLGLDTTLVLINGRRAIPNSHGSFSNAIDLSAIPYAAIERIEILADSASAVYGADAVGGVINVVLKKESQHTTLNFDYGASEGGFDERRASLATGFSTELFRSTLVFEYFDRDSLMGNERDLWRDQDYRRFGGDDWRAANSNPARVNTSSGGESHLQSLSRYRSILPEARRASVAASVERELSSDVNAFAELLYANRYGRYWYEPALVTGGLIPASNPHSPFDAPVWVDYLFTGIGPRQAITESALLRSVIGFRAQLLSWDWEVSLLKAREVGRTQIRNEVSAQRVAQSLAATDPSLALDVFTDGPGGDPSLLSWLREEPRYLYQSYGTQVTAVLRGDLAHLPAGDVQLVLGGEWLVVAVSDDETSFVRQNRDIFSAFTELRLPLVSGAMKIPAVADLYLGIAARLDHYSDLGVTFNPQYSLTWAPVADLELRASFSTGYRAPSLTELYAPRTMTSGIQVPDPMRDNAITAVTLITGGNSNLKTTEAKSLTAGLAFLPRQLRGLELSCTYWQIEMARPVHAFSYSILIRQEQQFSERVTRDAPSAEDAAAGRPGILRSLDVSRINSGKVDTSGVDVAGSYAIDARIGRFTLDLAAAWVREYETVDMPGTGPTDRVDVANPAGTVPRWRAVGTFGWERQGVSLSTTARYVPSYRDANSFTALPNGRNIPSQTLVDVQTGFEVGEMQKMPDWLAGLRLTVGVVNLFDQEAEFAEVGGALGTDTTQMDMRQRFGYVKVSASF